MGWLIEPLQYGFMQIGLSAAVLIGVACATLGVYVVLRSMAFFGGALAHAVLPGIVAAYLLGWSLIVGAVIAALLTALGIGSLSQRQALREDTAIGVIMTGMFALGIAMMSAAGSFRDLSGILFGDILGVTGTDMVLLSILTIVVIATLFLFHKELELTSFDPSHAAVIGLNADRVRYGLLVLLALTVVAGIQAVGVVLTGALLITPAAAASLLTNSLPRMMTIASAIAVVSGVVGIYASYYLDVASGPAIVLTCTAIFGISWAVWFVRRRTEKESYRSPIVGDEITSADEYSQTK
ncbi:MAG: metal ABC transporter permease [Rubrobacteraceae bacterium]